MVFGISSTETPTLIFVLFLFYIFTGIKFRRKDIFAPWIITPAVWSVMCLFLIIWGDIINQLRGPFYIALIIWTSCLYFSSIFIYRLTPRYKLKTTIFNKRLFLFLVGLSMILTPIYLYIIYNTLGIKFNHLLLALRENAVNGASDFGILKYLKVLNPALLIAALLQYKQLKKIILVYLVIANILMGIAIMEKGTFFLILTAFLYILYIQKIITLKTILISLSCFLGLSFVFNTIRAGSGSLGSFTDFFAIYIISPCAAFETIKPESSEYWGAASLPFFYIFNNLLFATDFEIVSKVKDFVFVPVPTNVYTIMQPFYEDFGYWGVGIFGIITGTISGYIYKLSSTGSPIMIGVYVYILYSLILQFFQDNIFVSLSVVIQFSFFMWLIYSKNVFGIIR